jgi:hypothetical protein
MSGALYGCKDPWNEVKMIEGKWEYKKERRKRMN